MAKGFFMQGVCLLTDGKMTIEDVKAALSASDIEVLTELPGTRDQLFSGRALVVPYRQEVNGLAVVDILDSPWPDGMGHPKEDAETFMAWSMGAYGPLTFPGGLERAMQHSYSWRPGRTLPDGHRGVVRLRISYLLGAEEDALVAPSDQDFLDELNFLMQIVRALLPAPGVLCYFNPNGEVLADREHFEKVWESCTEGQTLPLPLWSNIRFHRLNEQFFLMDTVGNGQLEIQDVEAIFSVEHEPGDIDSYLRNVSLYLNQPGIVIEDGESIDGPGETELSWRIQVTENGSLNPPRPTLRLFPKMHENAIPGILAQAGIEE